jgi:hypothetical protein
MARIPALPDNFGRVTGPGGLLTSRAESGCTARALRCAPPGLATAEAAAGGSAGPGQRRGGPRLGAAACQPERGRGTSLQLWRGPVRHVGSRGCQWRPGIMTLRPRRPGRWCLPAWCGPCLLGSTQSPPWMFQDSPRSLEQHEQVSSGATSKEAPLQSPEAGLSLVQYSLHCVARRDTASIQRWLFRNCNHGTIMEMM